MATISQVEAALGALINTVLYPNGTPPSALGYPVKIYAGWPDPETLDIDLVETSGSPKAAHVSIYPLPTERNVTRYSSTEAVGTPNPATYTLAASGQQITVGGTPAAYLQNLAVLINGTPYLTQATNLATTAIAAALQALIVVGVPGTTVSGSVITLPAGARIGALRVGTTAAVTQEVKRQERQFQIAVWSSNPTSRAAIADLIDPVLAANSFVTLADGTSGRLLYVLTREDDFTQKQRIYRRSLIYSVEFATELASTATQIVSQQEFLEDSTGVVLLQQNS